jgi:hypothetical protein
MTEILYKARKAVAHSGGSEVLCLVNNEGLQDLWRQRQDILERMNTAKKMAADEAAVPYLDALAELDEEYSMLLRMIGENGGT